MHIDATLFATAQGDAVAVEEFQNFDRDFAAILDLVAKLRRDELAVGCVRGQVAYDPDHLGRGAAQEEMIVRDSSTWPSR